ncbi:hypothetical protein RIF29_15509 [Crotalaria pallida]|uniref:Longin domain-containing protein n=1 Tax=Crotalaria pallida TaxID=3830 RepID=A0AAN9FDA0_CROPI
MGIFYAMVARGQVVLAEFSAMQSNASVVAKQILEKINQGNNNNNSNASYSHDRYVFHVKRTDGLTVICMANDAIERRIPFAFLEDIHERFVQTYGRAILSAPAYAMNDEFSRVLSQQMDYYSTDPNADRLNRLKGEMTQASSLYGNPCSTFHHHHLRYARIYLPWSSVDFLLELTFEVYNPNSSSIVASSKFYYCSISLKIIMYWDAIISN